MIQSLFSFTNTREMMAHSYICIYVIAKNSHCKAQTGINTKSSAGGSQMTKIKLGLC